MSANWPDGPGLLARTPLTEIREGRYRLAVEMGGTGPIGVQAATLTVKQGGRVTATRPVSWDELSSGVAALPFEIRNEKTLQFEIETFGTGDLAVGLITATPTARPVPRGQPIVDDLLTTLAWVLATAVLGSLAVRSSRSRLRPGSPTGARAG